MNQSAMFDNEGHVLRDHGISLATSKADSVEPNWSDQAAELMLKFLDHWQFNDFTAEEAQLWMKEKGLNEPASSNAWGGVILRLSKRGQIKKVGITNAKRKSSHARPLVVWRKVGA